MPDPPSSMLLTPILFSLPLLPVQGATPVAPVVDDATEAPARIERHIGIMGTHLTVEVTAATRMDALAASEAAVRAIEEVEARLSTWRDDSELSRLNRHPVGEPFALSPALEADLGAVARWHGETAGAFDPVVGALAEAWGLRTGGRQPSDTELTAARDASGWHALSLLEGTATRFHADARLDEGAWGKGVGLDAAAARLLDAGVLGATLDLGGQVLHVPVEGEGTPWWGIADPRDRARTAVEVQWGARSLATSGNSERGIEVAGERRSHVLDPLTGRPAADFGSLTVFAPDATTADCLSTALFVLGPDAALAWAEQHAGIDLVVLEVQDGDLRARASSGLRGRVHPRVDALEVSYVAPPVVAPVRVAAPTPGADVPADIAKAPANAASLALRQDDELVQRVEAVEAENADLRNRIDILTDEYEAFTLGDLVPPIGDSYSGLGPSASKVYGIDSGLSIGGYGEGVYAAFSGNGPDSSDLLRTIMYFGYKFDDRWVLNTEVEFEHAGSTTAVEFAYLDYLATANFAVRTGLVLIPMGFLGELHEPSTFMSVTRPATETYLMPSTWRENGVGVYGDAGGFTYRAYVVNGLDASGFSSMGLRGGRQKGDRALSEDLALVVRTDYVDQPGLVVGGSIYHGNSGQDQTVAATALGIPGVTTTIYEGHAELKRGPVWLRALFARARLADVTGLNNALALTGAGSVGTELEGFYAEAGYDLFAKLAPERQDILMGFARWEKIDTQAAVPLGFTNDPTTDESIITVGCNWKPIPQLVFKLEVQDWKFGADRVNAGMGWVF